MIYNIPVTLIEQYRDHNLILRANRFDDITAHLSEGVLERLVHAQIHALQENAGELRPWKIGFPVDVVMREPSVEFPQLYRYAKLLGSHPVRVSIPVVPGFGKAAKLAISLHFAVKLLPGQPGAALIDEMLSLAELYLHQSTASQPIEFFQSVLLAYYHQQEASLWTIQDEDPAYQRYIAEDGRELIAPRFENVPAADDFVAAFAQELGREQRECAGCEFFALCKGYFKWPDRSYSCGGIQRVLQTLRDAANELRQDLESFPEEHHIS
ncbi:hypothetical protein U14_04442 [Candidatus Moduliflexus flocculans]|uniref:Uncharacterized protein n=1 Tax=Candidatus Moduliflexus flocculans TaxID=1499966 RepID=A0A0S6W673_9BACT|nr:hypothetical protein U14_04442 [Candidatus Moduliflexus flocculans]